MAASRGKMLVELSLAKLGMSEHNHYSSESRKRKWKGRDDEDRQNVDLPAPKHQLTELKPLRRPPSCAYTKDDWIAEWMVSSAGWNELESEEGIQAHVPHMNLDRSQFLLQDAGINHSAQDFMDSTPGNIDPGPSVGHTEVVHEEGTHMSASVAPEQDAGINHSAQDFMDSTPGNIDPGPSVGHTEVVHEKGTHMPASVASEQDARDHVPGNEEIVKDFGDTKPNRRRTPAQKIAYNLKSHTLQPSCSETKCRKKCQNNITENERKTILHNFWSLDFTQRNLFLDGHINIQTPKVGKGLKSKSLTYLLYTNSGEKIAVCKTMFLSTLGLKTDGMITEFLKRKSVSSNTDNRIATDQRGKCEPQNKMDHEKIRTHINSFNPTTSHYRREHAPHRRYLDCYLTVHDMHNDYKMKGGNASYETYRSVFVKEKISFGYPPQDECDVCEVYKAHGHNEDSGPTCDICINHDLHLKRAQEARDEYRKSVGEETDVFTADMQKVILLPKMMTKEHFFVSRLVVFNETFARKTEGRDLVLLWHEAIAGRTAPEVASSYIKVLQMTEKPNVIFWTDNCSAQNKNWSLYTALATSLQEEWAPDSVTIKYLEKGHTFMKADSIHGAIGRKMKKEKEVITFSDFVRVCQKANCNIQTVELQTADFYTFKPMHRTNSSKAVKMPKLHDVVEVQFVKGKQSLSCREHSFSVPLKEVHFIKPSVVGKLSMPAKMSVPRGIQQSKKDAILSLLRATSRRGGLQFWLDLPANNSVKDLATVEA